MKKQIPISCSRTMELGIDIKDLNAVNLRNVPPTSANSAPPRPQCRRGEGQLSH